MVAEPVAPPSGGRSSPQPGGPGSVSGDMNLLRQLELRIESLLEGAAGRVFRGPLHPVEIAARLMREADLASTTGDHGPIAPNEFEIHLNPADLPPDEDTARLAARLADLVDESAFERGWRMDGPVGIRFSAESGVAPGGFRCTPRFHAGPRSAWAQLRGEGMVDLTVNHCVIGRDPECDAVVAADTTSRRHALVWRIGEQVLIRDLGSANGTVADGRRVGEQPVEIGLGSILVFGEAGFRLEGMRRA